MQWIPPVPMDDRPNKDESLKEMQRVSSIFLDTLEKFIGKRCLVSFAVIDEERGKIGTGVSLSKGSNGQDFVNMVFHLNSRYSTMVNDIHE